ncbi:MAG: hypothetical protein JWR61_3343 [Ferruginibacter sp.]|uniref:hypothetical protein n=1 Tax=Ferruginibacter sp. TaxID=1940288 RepID=UPI002659D673|nr:hypothetical protein [Ferruginibacter sp.]MDB5278388.1 hypothetical protein [Ferruginibacter sp.]
METSDKIKLSSDLIFTKLVCVFGLLLSLVLVFGSSKNTIDDDFKTDLEHKLLLLTTTVLTGYLLTRPSICYDDTNLYIKKISKKETIIPLKNVTSFFENPFVNKGTAIYTIEYKNNSADNDSIKFAANHSSESIKTFKILIRKINPPVEIV